MESPKPDITIVHPWELVRQHGIIPAPLPLPIPAGIELPVREINSQPVNKRGLASVHHIMPHIINQPKPQNGDRRGKRA